MIVLIILFELYICGMIVLIILCEFYMCGVIVLRSIAVCIVSVYREALEA